MNMYTIPESKSPIHTKVIVKPILWTMLHKHAYQGPCRYGQGYSLTYEYDVTVAEKAFARFLERIDESLDKNRFEAVNPVMLSWNEDFVIRDSVWEKALSDDANVDVYLICGLRISGYFTVELSKRTSKAIIFVPSDKAMMKASQCDISAHLFAIGRKEVYPCLDMTDVEKALEILQVKKMFKSLRVFFPLKNAELSFGCQSSYITLDMIRDRFGVDFSHVNAEQVLSALDELTEDEREACKTFASSLAEQAIAVHYPAQNIANDVEFYLVVKKMMKDRDCNAFTIPCFEVCATRELNRRQVTFCLAKSLLREEGIPSACAGDVGSVITNALLMTVANAAPYMGNTMVWDRHENLCKIQHDSPTRFMKGYDKPMMPFELVNFAMDGWGTTIRYDFAKDVGQTVTLANMSPDMSKIMIATGTIDGCENYLKPECTLAMMFKVKDAERFIELQNYVGHHFCMVYGDCSQKLADVAKAYGMEVLKA